MSVSEHPDVEIDDSVLPDIPKPEGGEDGSAVVGWSTVGSKARSLFEQVGDIIRFSGEAVRSLPKLRLYPTEVIRQTALLIIGSGLIIWVMEGVMGLECGTEASYILKQIGAPLYSGIFDSWCAVRECAPYMWGYILSAKVGCGLVAEIGSMRISDEISALESLGVDSMRYVVGTRLMAALLVMPVIYVIGVLAGTAGSYVTVVHQIREVSMGGWSALHWGYQSLGDNIVGLLQAMACGFAIVIVATFYGYRTRGGPVEVGQATARSMIVNLVAVHLIILAISTAYWGGSNAHLPIGG